MVYLEVITVVSLLISIIAVSIAGHTKLQQRESRELRGLAQKLKEVIDSAETMKKELCEPRTHEDLDLCLDDIAKEALTCKHETGDEIVNVSLSINGHSRNRDEVEQVDNLVENYESNEVSVIDVTVGNVDELYATDRNLWLHDSIGYSSFIYESIDDIEEEHSEQSEEFDSDLLEEFRSHIDNMVERTSRNILQRNSSFEINVDEFESTDEIGDYVFEKVFHYDGFEQDIDTLEELLDELEELRKTVLQASYS